jgi:hypothetical protein
MSSNKCGGQRHRKFLKHTWSPFYIVSQPYGHVWTVLRSKSLGQTWWRFCVATSASNMWQSHAHVRNSCPRLQFDTCARVFKHKRALNERNFVASTLVITAWEELTYCSEISSAFMHNQHSNKRSFISLWKQNFFQICCLFGLYSHVYRNRN